VDIKEKDVSEFTSNAHRKGNDVVSKLFLISTVYCSTGLDFEEKGLTQIKGTISLPN
jgi:hypothetical protein